MAKATGRRQRARGGIDVLPSGTRRIRVYAGIDPLTGKRNYLTETIPAGPGADAAAEEALTRLLNQVNERRHPRTKATVNQLLDRWLGVVKLEETTRRGYVSKLDRHVRPVLGQLQLGQLDPETLDSFYATLSRCRTRCNGRKFTEHRTTTGHDCDERCKPHLCKPLSDSTVRQIHWILRGALGRAVRWRWIPLNPLDQAIPPAQPRPNPRPPSPEEAGRILESAPTDPDWGTLLWLAVTTGARRGELCAVRWADIDLDHGVLTLSRSIAQVGGKCWEKDTKTHQQRRIALDEETVAILRTHRKRWQERALALGSRLRPTAYVFSLAPDASTHLRPDSVTQRYDRMATKLGIQTSLHKLRHYSATELIAAGVDIRTVAGRLGHGGGGATTLRVYSAWVAESDQRAAASLAARLPQLPRPGASGS